MWGGREGDLWAFSPEGCQIAGAHSDPRKERHQEPQRTGNKSDPCVALSPPLPAALNSPLHPLHALRPPPYPFRCSPTLVSQHTREKSPLWEALILIRWLLGKVKGAEPTCQHVNHITDRLAPTSPSDLDAGLGGCAHQLKVSMCCCHTSACVCVRERKSETA